MGELKLCHLESTLVVPHHRIIADPGTVLFPGDAMLYFASNYITTGNGNSGHGRVQMVGICAMVWSPRP